MQIDVRYTPTIMDGPVIRWQFGRDQGKRRDIFSGEEFTDWSAEINASRNGVSLNADYFPTLTTPEAIDAVTVTFRKAWDAYQAMRGAPDAHDVAKRIVERLTVTNAV